MSRREELKRIIDNLPEEKLPDPIEFLKSLIPEEDEEIPEEEWKAINEARERVANGEYVTLDELLKD